MTRNPYSLDNIQDKKAFMIDCIDNSYLVLCDELDCSKSWARVPANKSASKILNFTDHSKFVHWVFIVRDMEFIGGESYIQAGLRVSGDHGIDYFIFAHIKLELLDYFVKKYNLKEIE